MKTERNGNEKNQAGYYLKSEWESHGSGFGWKLIHLDSVGQKTIIDNLFAGFPRSRTGVAITSANQQGGFRSRQEVTAHDAQIFKILWIFVIPVSGKVKIIFYHKGRI